jgi:F420-dependent oxidoreductase-like protein
MTRLGLQIPNFTYPDVRDEDLFERVAAVAVEGENAGFDTVLVMDHFYQLPALGAPDLYMLEAYTLLGALAARTRKCRLSSLVTGNTYRNPALLAKIVTTLDVVSKGRAMLGIGAGWFEPEHEGYGFEFPPLGERISRLEEALQIIRPMLRDARPSFDGRFYRAKEAINSPHPIQENGVPILIGGNGEKRTLRLVARYADESNLTCAPGEIPQKLEALERHCAELGRDRSEICVTWLGSVVLAKTRDEAQRVRAEFFARRGIKVEKLPENMRRVIESALVVGDPDGVGEFVQRELIGRGLDGVIVNLPLNGHDPEIVRLAGETLRKALG